MDYNILLNLLDLIINLDEHLISLINTYGMFVYAIIFLIIFCETGLVVTPFLPGDSLLFAIGLLSSQKTETGAQLLDPGKLAIMLANKLTHAQTVDSCNAPSGATDDVPATSDPDGPVTCLPVFSPRAPP